MPFKYHVKQIGFTWYFLTYRDPIKFVSGG